jgi:hypothetical protein
MPQLDPVTIKVIAEDVASKVLREVRAEMQKTGEEAPKTASGFDLLSKSVKGLATAATAALVLREVTQFMRESAQEAIVAEKAQVRLETALRNSGKATEAQIQGLKDYAKALQDVTTFTDDSIISAQALFATYGLNADQIEQVTPRLLDLASTMEKTGGEVQGLESLARLLGKSLAGEEGVGALSKYVKISSDVEQQLIDTKDPVQRLNILLRELDSRYKGMAEGSAKTLGGQLQQMNNQWNDMKEEVGFALLPVLVDFGKIILENKDDIKEFGLAVVEIVKSLEPLLKLLGDIVGLLGDFARESREGTDVLRELTGATEGWAGSLLTLASNATGVGTILGLFAEVKEEIEANPIKPEIDTSSLDAAKKTVQDILQSIQDLEQQLLGSQQDQTTERLNLIKNQFEQLRSGETLNVSDITGPGQFKSDEETRRFLKEQGIATGSTTGGEIGQEAGIAGVEAALKQNELKEEQIDISDRLQEAFDAENKIVAEHVKLLESGKNNAKAEQDAVLASFELIQNDGPQVTSILKDKAREQERSADSAEREADAMERILAAVSALSELRT